MQQLQLAACSPSVNVEANKGSEAHAVHVGEVFEIERQELAGGGDFLQVGVEVVGETGYQATVALYEGDFTFTEDLLTERLGGEFFGHVWLRAEGTG
jgi:hypothetical protein